eukprot:8399580-Prorocentrum_lima.AAC.1
MTSSLVGSEMCIRDSKKAVLRHVLPPPRLSGSSGDPPKMTEMQAPVTVSYTHLTLPTICSV